MRCPNPSPASTTMTSAFCGGHALTRKLPRPVRIAVRNTTRSTTINRRSAVARKIRFTEIGSSLLVRTPPVDSAYRFQLLEHLLHFVFILGTQQGITGRRGQLFALIRRLTPELAVGDAIEQRFPRIAPQMAQQTGRGIEIAGIENQKTVAVGESQVNRKRRVPAGLIQLADVGPGDGPAAPRQMSLKNLDRRPQR